jgi:hypothetical protein
MPIDYTNPLTASPGSPGRIKFKCVLWSNCPTYARPKQDQAFIMSPETIQFAPNNLKHKILAIPGLDGIFLRPIPNLYTHNYVSFVKNNYSPPQPSPTEKALRSLGVSKYNWSDVFPLEALEFAALNKDLTANDLVLEGNSAITSAAIASHQTWIADGSLFCDTNLLPSEYGSVQSILPLSNRMKKTFCTSWSYRADPVGQIVDSTGVSSRLQKSSVQSPVTGGVNYGGSPTQLLKENGLESSPIFKVSDNVYKNINPGLHWRMLKRTPIFQGEDFSVEFSVAAEGSNIGNKNVNFRMLEKFDYLDVFSVNDTNVCGSLNGDGLIDKDKSNGIIENTKKVFDFSRQVYYMIEIGVKDPNHNYIIIISENSYPIFCHIGKVPFLSCSLESQGDPNEALGLSIPLEEPPFSTNSDSQEQSCKTSADQSSGRQSSSNFEDNVFEEITMVLSPKKPILRKLSTFDLISSAELLSKNKLRISVRQHSGNLVIVFGGYEDKPWVISRRDINSNETPIGVPVSDSQIKYDSVNMLIPFGQIALMGGNRKCGFNFCPLLYNSLTNFVMPQPFSVDGPVDANEIQFLWREKGVSQSPEVSVNNLRPQYVNEAGVYKEIAIKNPQVDNIKVQNTKIYAIDVQPSMVFNYGKAPDMMKNTKAEEFGIYPSEIEVLTPDCNRDQGSTAGSSKLVQAVINIKPGGYLFPAIDGGLPWALNDCITPIVFMLRLYVPPKGCMYTMSPVDVSQHVLSFSDEWSETDWQKLEHTGSISFLVSEGMKFKNNMSNYLYTLVDKAFYLQISIWWEDGIMPFVSDPRDRVVFTGFCKGGVVSTETNKKTLDCKLVDYSQILKDQIFFNSPFFDRMRDVNAVRDILNLAGLRDGEDNGSTFEPGSLIRQLAESEYKGGWYNFVYNKEKIYNREYSLPGSYDILQSPFLRFQDGSGSTFWDAIEKFALLANKVAYFDRLGVFHFNPLPYDQEVWGGQSGSKSNWSIQDWSNLSKVDFFATPKQLNINGAEMHRQIIGDYKVERVVQDVFNQIKILSTSPNGEVFVAGHTNYASLNDPSKPGFLGYRKPFLQQEGIFGSADTVKWMVKNYTRMFIPPIKVSFRAIGRNNIKALDVITFQPLGSREKQPLVINSIKTQVDASKNTWFQDFECLWLFERQDVVWGNTNEIGLGADGSISGLTEGLGG